MIAARRQFLGHPRGLTLLAASEAWERFSFYGLQALLTLYMVRELLLPGHIGRVAGLASLRGALQGLSGPMSDQALASAIFGLYGGAIYMTPILGGLLADRWLGRRRTVILGALLMAAGHLLMTFEPPFLLALACMVLGAGCFKGNIAAQVGALYAPHDQRRADAFQIFYAGINVGAVFAPLVCGTLGEEVGWRYGFGVAGLGMLAGLAIYLAGWRDLPPEAAAPEVASEPAEPVRLTRHELKVMALLFGLLPFLALGLVANQQIGNAYLLWARDHIDTHVAGHALPLTWLLSLETIATLACLAGSARFWALWARRRPEPDEMTKVVLGQGLMTAAPLLLVAASAVTASTGRPVSLAWPVGFSLLNEIGFANVLPVTLALYTRLAPRPMTGAIVGVYYLQLVGANLLAGVLGGLLDRLSAVVFWSLHAALAAVALVTLFAVRGFFKSLLA